MRKIEPRGRERARTHKHLADEVPWGETEDEANDHACNGARTVSSWGAAPRRRMMTDRQR